MGFGAGMLEKKKYLHEILYPFNILSHKLPANHRK
jgi:hypothetical protein